MVQKLIQTCLNISDTGQLIFVAHPPLFLAYPNLRPNLGWPTLTAAAAKITNAPNAGILRLPDELLQQCLQAVADLDAKLSEDHDYYYEHYWGEDAASSISETEGEAYEDKSPRAKVKVHIRYEFTHALIMTCKRFHAIAIPMLYARPQFDTRHYEEDRLYQCERFHDTISRNPTLRLFVKHLVVQGRSLKDDFVQTCLKLPHLKSLKLIDARDEDGEDQGGGSSPVRARPQLRQRLLSEDKGEEEGTAKLNELRLCQIRARPRDVKRFLGWPHQLRVFALDDVTIDGCDWDYAEPDSEYRWSHAILTDVLSPQRLNLQIIQLGWMGYTRDQNQFDVSMFPNLHTLQLCIAREKPDAVACQNWLTSNLRTIILDTGQNDMCSGKRSNFNRYKKQMVIDFTRLASEAKKQRPEIVALKETGFLAYHTGDDLWNGTSEWRCDHQGWYRKTEILKVLKAIEGYGFSAFWVGASGATHTAKMIEEVCSLCADATANVSKVM